MKQVLKGKWPIFIALASVTINLWANNINQVCLDAIYTEFQGANAFLQGYIVGGTSFISLAFVLLTGVLAKKISKKLILMGALILYLIGGVGGGFAQTMLQYAIFRTVMGAATGILSTIVLSIMFEYFPNPDDSAKIMGAYQLCNTLAGTLISYLAGVLCVISWRTAQWINAGAILALVCVAVLLPRAPEVAAEDGEGWAEEGGSGRTKMDVPRVVLTLVEAILFIIMTSIFQYFVSVYLAERQIGDAALAGTLMSVSTITGAVINIFFAKLFKSSAATRAFCSSSRGACSPSSWALMFPPGSSFWPCASTASIRASSTATIPSPSMSTFPPRTSPSASPSSRRRSM